MTSSVEKIRDSFPFLTVDPIVGQPTYEAIKELQKKLNANAASIHSHLGNGKLGLLYLTMTPEVYNTLSDVAFVPPLNPGPNVTYPPEGTQYQIRAAEKLHSESTKLFKQYDACDKALKQMLIGAVDGMFLTAKCDPYVGFANTTTLELLTHLYKTYGRISDVDLRKNQELLSDPFDANLPIESFFRRVEECVDFASAGQTPFSPQQVVISAFYTVQKSGYFPDDAKEWRRLPEANKTWEEFKIHFSRAYHELKETMETAQSAGFHGANNAYHEETAVALNNLANAAVADKRTMENLTNSVNSLTQQLALTNEKLREAQRLTISLQNELQNSKKGGNNGKIGKKSIIYDKYCWTHGPKCSHTSSDCNRRVDGHKVEATEENRMGGRETKWFSPRN